MNAVSQITAIPQLVEAQPARYSKITLAVRELQNWIEVRDYAGYEPYDILNSPLFSAVGLRLRTADWALIQIGKRFGGNTLRALLRHEPESTGIDAGWILRSV